MRKTRIIRTFIIVACIVGLVLAFPALIYVPLGFLRGEAFFHGKPTEYWAHALKKEPYLGQAPPSGDVGKTLREGGAAAVPVLCAIAENPDEDLRSEALLALSLMGSEATAATPVLLETIQKETNSGRFLLASETLAKVDPAAAADALSAVVRDRAESDRRAWALAALLAMAPEGRGALPVLNELLHDGTDDVRLRVQAIRVLWHLQQPAGPLVSTLCQIVSADASPAGVQALEALGEMGPAAGPAVPTLVKLLDNPRLALVGHRWGPPHRAAVIRTLGQIGPQAGAAVPALLASLNRDNYFIRTEVAQAVARIGPPARDAVTIRDAAWCTTLTLSAPPPPTQLAVLPLVQTCTRTWVPRDAPTAEAAHAAILRVDPDAAARAGRP
jgi:HEAT repeat protein